MSPVGRSVSRPIREVSFDRGAVHYVILDDVHWPGSDGFQREVDNYLVHIPVPKRS